MAEFYIEANSFAAPFFSDTSHAYIEAPNAAHALEKFAAEYTHPAGLYSAVAYTSSDAMKKGEKALAKWLCNHEIEKARIFAETKACSYLGHGAGDFEIGGVRHKVENPKQGRIV